MKPLRNLLVLLLFAFYFQNAKVLANDSILYVPQLNSAPVIDGFIDDVWNDIQFTSLNKNLNLAILDTNSYMVKFKAGWFKSKIYLLVDVKDDTLVDRGYYTSTFQDNIQLVFDFIRDSAAYNDINAFWMSAGIQQGSSSVQYCHNWCNSLDSVEFATTRITNGYIYEYVIDGMYYKGLNIHKPNEHNFRQDLEFQPNDTIYFNIEAQDRDDTINRMPKHHLSWYSGSTGYGWADPIGQTGRMILQGTTTLQKASQSITKQSISLFPNPAKDWLNVKYLYNSNSPYIINIANLEGKIVLSQKVEYLAETHVSLNISSLAKGVYFVRVAGKDFNASKKFFIE